MFNDIFNGKNVVLTGHTGFKGSWLLTWLQMLGAKVTAISLDPSTSPSLYSCIGVLPTTKDLRIDIRNFMEIQCAINEAQPDFLFHLAGQAIVKQAYKNPIETWTINVIGTLNILESLRTLNKKCSAVLITSDKCYENKEWVWGYRESDQLGGKDPYSASKASAELAIWAHNHSFFSDKKCNIHIASARAGNVIAGGDWSTDRIVPDAVKAWANSDQVNLRYPNATRPWQHVLEPLFGYLTLAAKLHADRSLHGESFNFGPGASRSKSVKDLVMALSDQWGGGVWAAEDSGAINNHEAGLLQLSCEKAHNLLGWSAFLTFEEVVSLTMQWYKAYYENPTKAFEITTKQIESFSTLSQK